MVRRLVSSAATRRREASCWLRASSIALRSNTFIAACCDSTQARRRRCSSARARRTLSSSGSSRDIAPPVRLAGVAARAAAEFDRGRGRNRALVRGGLLLLVGGGRLDLADHGLHELAAHAVGHALGELLVVERGERLSAAAPGEEVGLERAVFHLLEERPEESLSDPLLGLGCDAVVLGLRGAGQARRVGQITGGDRADRGARRAGKVERLEGWGGWEFHSSSTGILPVFSDAFCNHGQDARVTFLTPRSTSRATSPSCRALSRSLSGLPRAP